MTEPKVAMRARGLRVMASKLDELSRLLTALASAMALDAELLAGMVDRKVKSVDTTNSFMTIALAVAEVFGVSVAEVRSVIRTERVYMARVALIGIALRTVKPPPSDEALAEFINGDGKRSRSTVAYSRVRFRELSLDTKFYSQLTAAESIVRKGAV